MSEFEFLQSEETRSALKGEIFNQAVIQSIENETSKEDGFRFAWFMTCDGFEANLLLKKNVKVSYMSNHLPCQ